VYHAILERVMASSKLDEDQREALERSADLSEWLGTGQGRSPRTFNFEV
jgi:hypothetical protein